MTFNINWEKKGVFVKFRGNVTAQDLIDANNYIISNVQFDTIEYQIFDFLHIDKFNISSYDISIIGVMDKAQTDFKKDMKIAIITKDDYVREIIVEYDHLMSGTDWITRIFSSIGSANLWVSEK